MFIELVGIAAGSLGIVSYMPQVIKVVRTKQTHDLAIGMWWVATLANALWVMYGLLKHNPTLVTANSALLVMAVIILIYKVRYG